MKVLRHRKWTLCLVIICFLSFFAPFSLESDTDLGKIHKDTRKISAFVRFPVPETFSPDRNDIQDLTSVLKEAAETGRLVTETGWRRKQTGFMNWMPLLPSAAKVSSGGKDASLPGSVKRREKPPGRTAVMLEILYDKDGKKKCFPGFEHSQDCRKKWS